MLAQPRTHRKAHTVSSRRSPSLQQESSCDRLLSPGTNLHPAPSPWRPSGNSPAAAPTRRPHTRQLPSAAPLLRPTGDTPGYPSPAPVGLSGHLKSAQSPRTQRPGGSSPPRVASSQGTCGGRRGCPGPGVAGAPHGCGGEGGATVPGAGARPAAAAAPPGRGRPVRPSLAAPGPRAPHCAAPIGGARAGLAISLASAPIHQRGDGDGGELALPIGREAREEAGPGGQGRSRCHWSAPRASVT